MNEPTAAQNEYERLPQWARDIVDVMADCYGYGGCACTSFPGSRPKEVSTLTVHTANQPKLFDALVEARRIGLNRIAPPQ